MNINTTGGNMAAFASLAIFFGLFSAVFWMYVGWRAMIAHERLSQAAEMLARKSKDDDKPSAP